MSFRNDESDVNWNFDLPEPDKTVPAKPRVHNSGEAVCVACEG